MSMSPHFAILQWYISSLVSLEKKKEIREGKNFTNLAITSYLEILGPLIWS